MSSIISNQNLMETTKIPWQKLKKSVDETELEFETTAEVPTLTSIVGQERGRAAMSFGLKVNKSGYNIYVSGIAGTGKTSYTNSIVQDFANVSSPLFDWCYVYNFEDSANPRMLKVPAGCGKSLKADIPEMIEQLKNDIPRAFNEESYQKERQAIVRNFKEESSRVFQNMNQIANQYGFFVRQASSGLVTIPLIDGRPISEEEFRSLNDEQRKEMDQNSALLQERLVEFTNDMRKMEKKVKSDLEALDSKVASIPVGYLMGELMKKYEEVEEIIDYLKEVQTDILNNTNDFHQNDEEEENPFSTLFHRKSDTTNKYHINLLIDNSTRKGVPVVNAENPTYYNLMGKVEYENRMGVLSTDFTKIKPGYLHQANGGYLILQAKDLLSNTFAWEALKRALKNESLRIENIEEKIGVATTTSLRPEPIPLHVKVILIGSPDIYQLLFHYDEDFRKLFKIRADFDVEMDYNTKNIKYFASFIHTRCKEEGLKDFDKTAVAKIVEYSNRLAGDQNKLSTRFNQIVEVIYEADTWADLMGASIVRAVHVKKAIEEKCYRSNLYEEKIQESMESGDILIDTDGVKVGQVNGLAVYQTGQYSFGKPSRITASTYVGQSGIINIERESKMSGNIHNKGVYILSGFLGGKFAQKQPLALSAYLAFEQSYGGVDGDSASSTELYAILSSLAEAPINQGFAVTGSINQKGEIQPIGGINEKVEGFFDICKVKGLSGTQGVLIPHQNVKNLMLKDEVIEAVKKGQFHIHQVKTVEEGIELLTGIPAGFHEQASAKDTIYKRVAAKLKDFINTAMESDDK